MHKVYGHEYEIDNLNYICNFNNFITLFLAVVIDLLFFNKDSVSKKAYLFKFFYCNNLNA